MNNVISEKLKTLPDFSGVYLMKDKDNNIIYVGKAKNLKKRVNQYFDKREKNLKTELLVSNIANFDYIVTNSEYDALMLENNLIKKYQPHYNILLKDGKNFAYIKLDLNRPFPKLEITRKIDFKKNIKYFGPYFNGVTAAMVMDLVKYAYPLRSCNLSFKKLEKRACLKYSIGECSAPCINKIDKVNYNKIVDEVINFLNGDTEKIKEILTNKMINSASLENFETAIVYKNQLEALDKLNNKYTTQFTKKLNIDVIGEYSLNNSVCISVLIIRNGKMIGAENFNLLNKFINDNDLIDFFVQYYSNNKVLPHEILVNSSFKSEMLLEEFFIKNFDKKVNIIKPQKANKKVLLETANKNAKEYLEKSLNLETLKLERTINACKDLQKKLSLKQIPLRIEGFDISNISGTNKVASMVVFINGEPAKSHYRKFKIKTVDGIDDFSCMKEVVKRRMEELTKSKDESFSSIPNLILIDGGKGQLSSASEIIREYNKNIDLISLAEKNEEIFKENSSIPIILKRSDYSLQLLQRVRDEAHRYAITFHRSLRGKNGLKSILSDIQGIGKVKIKILFNEFKTIDNLRNASYEDLIKIKGITKKDAENIIKYFTS
ncbi:MAG: excinuclease ABC subunit UvrC [Clostridiales bacterium]|nr:excinuclease ABC subunit UvrC [Clostridiales bacterium]